MLLPFRGGDTGSIPVRDATQRLERRTNGNAIPSHYEDQRAELEADHLAAPRPTALPEDLLLWFAFAEASPRTPVRCRKYPRRFHSEKDQDT
jgi:hypothetical protein